MLFKDPKTDDGTKRSQRGRIVVARKDDVLAENPDFDFASLTGDQTKNDLLWKDGLNEAETKNSSWNALQTVFLDGELLVDDSLATIRERIAHTNKQDEAETSDLRKYMKNYITKRWSKTN